MQDESRTSNSIQNTKLGITFQVVNLVVKFGMRTIFIYVLGPTYVGINGVFSNLLSVLALTELGIGSAIVYEMYKPIAKQRFQEITRLFIFYKKVYHIIGLIIFFLGLLICPFLNVIVKDSENIRNIEIIYILTLISTVVTYFYAQYTSIIIAHQKQYIITKCNIVACIIKAVIESYVLIVYKSYIFYLIIEIFINIMTNLFIAKKAIRMYPFLTQKKLDKKLPPNNIKKIKDNSLSAFSMKTAITIVNSTDNLLVSSMIGTYAAASFSTYMLIIKSVEQVIYTIKDSVLASVGNLCVSTDYNTKQIVFKRMRFIYAWINCAVVTCFLILLTPFIRLWAGDDYLLSEPTMLVLIINYFLRGIQWPVETFYSAEGLYQYFKIKPWIQVLLNLLFSFVLINHFGVVGVALGTTISEILTTFWYDIYIVNKFSLRGNLSKYYLSTFGYLGLTMLIALFVINIVKPIKFRFAILEIMLKGIISFGLSLFLFIIPFYKSENWSYCKLILKKFI